ncbi:protein kinase [Brachybacterium sp. JHP9]|uniref:Protein kinase n=1 Tax=Brachybacterium equifaecis TaxID=2910770 RepID=A0ABT0QZJ5_9MICO|nr:protein kinase [Brachybacterium equifaecis]MCL6423051.1 protein kinase [Brachybacterium equifaecis]
MALESTADPSERRDPRLVTLAADSGYRIHERIGAGGMGIVYRAHDADGNEVAIKLLRHDIADDARARERLAREVAAQRLVRHGGIVRIVDAELDSPEAFVVTEFIPGPTLEEAVRLTGGLHPELVRELGLVLSDALQVIHDAGVVHRDLKPSNVLLRGALEEDLFGYSPDGFGLDPVIIDFGIAIAAEESRMTSTGLVMGTAAYLDPDVMRRDQTGAAGDWWALAAVLAFAATGREPFGTGRADLVLMRAERGEIDLEGVPVELAEWLRAALRADPAARPSAAEMRERLEALDLTRYEDPGPTEVISRSALAGSSRVAAPTAALSRADDADRTQALPRFDEDADRTQALARFDEEADRTQALPRFDEDADRTQALPRVGADEDAGRTEALMRDASGADATQRIPSSPRDEPRASREPATEVFAPIDTATRPMPVVRDDPAAGSYREPVPAADGGAGHGWSEAPERAYATAAALHPHPGAALADPHPQYSPQHQAHPGYPVPQQSPQGYPLQQYAPMQQQAAAWQPPPPPPRRRLLVWLGHLILVALAVIAPYIALALVLVLGGLARTWEQSHRAVEMRRARGSAGSGPQVAAGFAAPFRFVGGVLVTALQALLPLVLGLIVGLAVDAAVTTSGAVLPDGAVTGIAAAIMLLLVWVGLGSRTTRNGAHRMVEASTPDAVWGMVVGALLLLLFGAVVAVILARGGEIDYVPFWNGPRLGTIAFWR